MAYCKNGWVVCVFLLALAYACGVLMPNHYLMYSNDFLLSLVSVALAMAGLVFGMHKIPIQRMGYSTLSWLALAVLMVVQPIFNPIFYPDGLVFPFGLFCACALLSVFAVNVSTTVHTKVLDGVAKLLVLVGLCSTVTQFVQLFAPNQFGWVAVFVDRIYGNIAQPNLASLVNVLAIVSLIDIGYRKQSAKNMLVLGLLALPLMAGIGLSLSRAGLILLAVAVLGSVLYPWQSQQKRMTVFGLGVGISVLGYQLGTWLLSTFLPTFTVSGVDRLVSDGVSLRKVLLERAWRAFLENPLFGVGYDRYLAHGLQHIEEWAWFEPADNAHNAIAQILAEFGLVGLLCIGGILVVLCKQPFLFFTKKITDRQLFVNLLLLILVLHSFSEFPLWYPNFLFLFVFLVGLIDKGFLLKKDKNSQVLTIMAAVLSCVATIYSVFYYRYLPNYEKIMFTHADNHQKIKAYKGFPTLFGFIETKELMLYRIVDEENSDIDKLIAMGNRLISLELGLNLTDNQMDLLIMQNQPLEAKMLARRICVLEHQANGNCNHVLEQISQIDPSDELGYGSYLRLWYDHWKQQKSQIN